MPMRIARHGRLRSGSVRLPISVHKSCADGQESGKSAGRRTHFRRATPPDASCARVRDLREGALPGAAAEVRNIPAHVCMRPACVRNEKALQGQGAHQRVSQP